MLKHVSARKIPTTICTMYNPNFTNPEQKQMCEPALSVLNHVIITESMKVCIDLYNTIFDGFCFSLVFRLLILERSLMIRWIM
jgi:hypothetical protein